MKGIIVDGASYDTEFLEEVLQRRLPSHSIEVRPRDHFDTTKRLALLLDERPDFIILPLTLPRYGSLRLGELVRSLDSQTKLILVSGTTAPPALLCRVFDAVLGLPFMIGDLLAALAMPLNRVSDSTSIQLAIAEILEVATCFSIVRRHSCSLVTMDDYRSGREPDEVEAEQRHIQRRVNILFMTSDPTTHARLRLGEEQREIQERLRLSSLRHKLAFHPRTSVRIGDISQTLLDLTPRIVHFCGHGDSDALYFEADDGSARAVNAEALAGLFAMCMSHLECVVLNACYSRLQAAAIARYIPFVIGSTGAILDRSALAFSAGFYKALGAGKHYKEAFGFGVAEIRIAGLPDGDSLVLLERCSTVSLARLSHFLTGSGLAYGQRPSRRSGSRAI